MSTATDPASDPVPAALTAARAPAHADRRAQRLAGTGGAALGLIGGASLLIQTLEGILPIPCLTGRASRMNPVATFAGVLARGWLRGIRGLLPGATRLMLVKALRERVDDFRPIGEPLGEQVGVPGHGDIGSGAVASKPPPQRSGTRIHAKPRRPATR